MNRAQRRRMQRGKPSHPSRKPLRIPKIVLQDRDFNQIELLMMKLANGEMEFVDGHYVMKALDGDRYCIVAALEGWIENFAIMAKRVGIEYDDQPLVHLKNRLANGMMLTREGIENARRVVDTQRQMYQALPVETISSVAVTTQIKLLQPHPKGAAA